MLTDTQKKEIHDEALAEIEKAKAESITRKIPGEVTVVKDEVDSITSDKKGGFKSLGHFLWELKTIEDKANTVPPATLVKWADACRKKTSGTMEEGDLSQGGYNVPTEFGEHIYADSLEGSIVRMGNRKENNTLKIDADTTELNKKLNETEDKLTKLQEQIKDVTQLAEDPIKTNVDSTKDTMQEDILSTLKDLRL